MDTDMNTSPEVNIEEQKHEDAYAAKLAYHKKYNAENREALLAKKKDRYENDPAYRERLKQRSRDYYEQKKKANTRSRVCEMCGRPMPRKQKPLLMSLKDAKGRSYEVLFFTIGELAMRLGRQQRTLKSWITERIIPESIYQNDAGRRLWTQDQIEALKGVSDKYDLRPPADYRKIGFVDEVQEEWNKLLPLGINPQNYVKDSSGIYHRRVELSAAS